MKREMTRKKRGEGAKRQWRDQNYCSSATGFSSEKLVQKKKKTKNTKVGAETIGRKNALAEAQPPEGSVEVFLSPSHRSLERETGRRS